jgi:HTH-type transcriptional regulator/antitoxin HigA
MKAVATAHYKQLIADFPPKVIRSEEENRLYLSKLTEMTLVWDDLSASERDLYETLKILVADFEKKTYKISAATPIEVIEELLEANDLKQKDLVGIFPTESVVSEVLRGNRALRTEHIKGLSERFNVSPNVFF